MGGGGAGRRGGGARGPRGGGGADGGERARVPVLLVRFVQIGAKRRVNASPGFCDLGATLPFMRVAAHDGHKYYRGSRDYVMCRACGMSNRLRENQHLGNMPLAGRGDCTDVRNGEDSARDIELAITEKVSLMPRTRREQPCSIVDATEVCAFCGQLYAYEMERR